MHKLQRTQEGQALILVLIFMVVFAAIIAAFLGFAETSFNQTSADDNLSHLINAANDGIEYGAQKIASNAGLCGTSTSQTDISPSSSQLNLAPLGVSVTCQPVVGQGTDTFGGYSVILGTDPDSLNNSSCTTLASDPYGASSYSQTYGQLYKQGSGSNSAAYDACSYYQQGAGQWASSTVPSGTPTLYGVYALDSTDAWAVGAAQTSTAQETILYFNGEAWTEVATPTNVVAIGGTTAAGPYITTVQLNGVWAVSIGGVDYVWAVGSSGTILYCTGDCSDTSSVWTEVASPASTSNITGISGSVDGSNLDIFAVGAYATTGTPLDTVLNYSEATSTPGAGTFADALTTSDCTPAACQSENLSGVWAVDNAGVPNVWAVGAGSTILNCDGLNCATGQTGIWSTQTATSGLSLTAVSGSAVPSASAPMWITGSASGGKETMFESTNGTTWTPESQTTTGAVQLNAVAAATGAGGVYMWGLGGATTTGATPPIGWYYCTICAPVWKASDAPSGVTTPTIYGATSISSPYVGAWAVGNQSTDAGLILQFTPAVTSRQPSAVVTGGNVLNGSRTALYGPDLDIDNGAFYQYQSSGVSCSDPTNTILPTSAYNCTTSLPAAVEPFVDANGNSAYNPNSSTSGTPQLPIDTGTGQDAYDGACTGVAVNGTPNDCPATTLSKSCTVTSSIDTDDEKQTVCDGILGTNSKDEAGYVSCSSTVDAEVFTPGEYPYPPNWQQGKQGSADVTFYYMEPGVYFFANTGQTWIPSLENENGSGTTYIIGGPPSKQDNPLYWNSSNPCWSTFTSSTGAGYQYYEPGLGTSSDQGTGNEWILGGDSWMDLHSGVLELFTRECATANPTCANEGTQGISYREVSPCADGTSSGTSGFGTCQTGWTNAALTALDGPPPTGPGATGFCTTGTYYTDSPCFPDVSQPNGETPGQFFQLDDSFTPVADMHGGVYAPNANVQLYSQATGAVSGESASQMGAIVANAVELGQLTDTTAPNQIAGGNNVTTTVEIVSTATAAGLPPLKEEAVVTLQSENGGYWYVTSISSWRMCEQRTAPAAQPAPPASPIPGCSTG